MSNKITLNTIAMIKNIYEAPECQVFETAPKMALCVSDWPGQNESMGEEDFIM